MKDETFTISIIGKPNVGKSTMFNRLMGERIALTDQMPGLTRDRREGITSYFNVPIRVVDTAGFEGTRDLDEANLSARHLNKQMVQDMLRQTRNALIYSDLALFMLDARQGIDYSDVALFKWLTDDKLRIRGVESKLSKSAKENMRKDFHKTDEAFFNAQILGADAEKLEVGKLPGMNILDSRSRKKRRAAERSEDLRQKSLSHQSAMRTAQDGVDFSAEIPPLIFIANKCEDGFEGDVLSDFYTKFPESSSMIDPLTGEPVAPIYVSAEHGDGLTDLLQRIQACIPETKVQQYSDRKAKRLERFKEYKQMLLDEIVKMREETISN